MSIKANKKHEIGSWCDGQETTAEIGSSIGDLGRWWCCVLVRVRRVRLARRHSALVLVLAIVHFNKNVCQTRPLSLNERSRVIFEGSTSLGILPVQWER